MKKIIQNIKHFFSKSPDKKFEKNLNSHVRAYGTFFG